MAGHKGKKDTCHVPSINARDLSGRDARVQLEARYTNDL